MKFVSFKREDSSVRCGVLQGGDVRPLSNHGMDAMLTHIVSGFSTPSFDEDLIPLSEVTLLAPLQHPPRIFGIGLNYREHAA